MNDTPKSPTAIAANPPGLLQPDNHNKKYESLFVEIKNDFNTELFEQPLLCDGLEIDNAVLAAVIGGRRDGLTAALVIFCVYSIAFAMRVVEGRPGGSRP